MEEVNNMQSTLSGEMSSSVRNEDSTVFSAWLHAIEKIKSEVSVAVYEGYLRGLTPGNYDEDSSSLTILAPSVLVRTHVEERFKPTLESLIFAFTNQSIKLKFELSEPKESSTPYSPFIVVKPAVSNNSSSSNGAQNNGLSSTVKVVDPAPAASVKFESNINPRYTFDNFVVGNSNQFCHAAAMQVADKPGVSYNPLFIYGGVGLGKTHLLHAIGNQILKTRPDAKILYLSSEAFTNELILALRNSKMDEFKAKMRAIEVLLIDDIQFMVGKERTQEEFFHTFNALYSAKHQIVISSDKIPSDIPQIEERLYTRFSWGLIADIQAPDFETRVAILKRKALVDGFEVPHDVCALIAEKVSSNVRELEGALTRIHAMSSLQNVPMTEELAVQSLKHLFQPKKINISVDDIKKAVASHFSLKVSEIISKRRTKNLSFPRHIAMYLCRKHTTCSYPEIGSHFGNRDHSSVIHAASVVTTKIKNDSSVREQVQEIEKALLNIQ